MNLGIRWRWTWVVESLDGVGEVLWQNRNQSRVLLNDAQRYVWPVSPQSPYSTVGILVDYDGISKRISRLFKFFRKFEQSATVSIKIVIWWSYSAPTKDIGPEFWKCSKSKSLGLFSTRVSASQLARHSRSTIVEFSMAGGGYNYPCRAGEPCAVSTFRQTISLQSIQYL